MLLKNKPTNHSLEDLNALRISYLSLIFLIDEIKVSATMAITFCSLAS